MASAALDDEASLGMSRLIGRLDLYIPMPRGAKPPPVRSTAQTESAGELDAPNRDPKAGS